MELDRSTTYHLDSKTPGPRFDINDTIRAIVLEFQSTYLFTLAYEKMCQFYREVGPKKNVCFMVKWFHHSIM